MKVGRMTVEIDRGRSLIERFLVGKLTNFGFSDRRLRSGQATAVKAVFKNLTLQSAFLFRAEIRFHPCFLLLSFHLKT